MTLCKHINFPISNTKGHRESGKLEKMRNGKDSTHPPPEEEIHTSFWKHAFTKKRSGPSGKYITK